MQTHRPQPPDTTAFYNTPIGQRVQTLIQRHLNSLHLPPCSRAIGIGDASPYASSLPEHTILARPAHSFHNKTSQRECVVDTTRLPFDDCSVPLIFAIHALEFAPSPPELLRALWKALTDDGYLILIVPNRSGLWAHSDRTPFGHGTPFSTGQIQKLLTQSLFKTDVKRSALITPPAFSNTAPAGFLSALPHISPPPLQGCIFSSCARTCTLA
ncbi:methyltransferase domain-containing protein [Neokomagataea tanensis]|uniref:Methyltransferase domain-containing protein n=1 Tax=Neokomagataea tanensis TaxID=661191 RepID=A0A4Y6V267_9PROT|nr:methyltransferase domain-containing protein [Neokomagataea tanensis]QDH24083.1 methyltransferase domain-containing protein [Neokomagataea tanensis]